MSLMLLLYSVDIVAMMMLMTKEDWQMTVTESKMFIEEMEELGDIWTQEQVMSAYADHSLEDALSDRRSSLFTFAGIIERILNR